MKFKFFTASVILLVAFAFPLHAQQSDTTAINGAMSLEECLEYAFVNSENIQNALLDIQIAKADVGVTKAQGLPQIDASVTYTNNFAVPTVYLPASAGNFVGGGGNGGQTPSDEEVALRFGIQHQSNATINASQMIFDGAYFVGLKAARVYSELARKDYLLTKSNIAEQVSKAYYTALVSQERSADLENNYQRLDSLLNETNLMYENGFAEKIDVDRIRVQFNNAKTQFENSLRSTEVSLLLLKFQMGMPIDSEIELSETIKDIEENWSVEDGNDFQYQDRFEFAKLQVNEQLVELDIKNNRVQYLPKITANANFGYNNGADNLGRLTDLSRWNELGSWGLNLSIPIFDGLQKYNRIQKNKLQLQQIQNSSSQLKNSIDLEIVQARVELENSIKNLQVQRENLELAEEVFRVTKIKYQEGIGSNIEVTDAQYALEQAETNYYSAMYDALIAKVDLEKALGKLINDQE
ncbi:TolC family protein [Catalinimonas sp. 4WD22]|uniref:TolC family protein n=1 Tax=Catalinimonas locisalis TaxID=3133978 RepID=UPI0031013EA3